MLGEVHIRTAVVESVNQVRSKGTNEIIDINTATDGYDLICSAIN
jgi:hypothetical protein